MTSKFGIKIIFFEHARSGKIVVSCYPCLRTSKSKLEQVQTTQLYEYFSQFFEKLQIYAKMAEIGVIINLVLLVQF